MEGRDVENYLQEHQKLVTVLLLAVIMTLPTSLSPEQIQQFDIAQMERAWVRVTCFER